MPKLEIQSVSDTATWVATYRALESKRQDALFSDPLAERLAGSKGSAIVKQLPHSKYANWTVIIRTVIIDAYIQSLILNHEIEGVLNLGAGLDTRPYRLDLPSSFKWIEVDFPHLIDAKEKALTEETPRCNLQRIRLDLSDRTARTQWFAKINSDHKKLLVLTEGVIPYLKNEAVASLAEDLLTQPNFKFWIVEYLSQDALKHMTNPARMKQMKHAPFQFRPEDGVSFFDQTGWKLKKIQYLAKESRRLGRPIPAPWFIRLIFKFVPKRVRDENDPKFNGFMLLEPKR